VGLVFCRGKGPAMLNWNWNVWDEDLGFLDVFHRWEATVMMFLLLSLP
jgi:hypothetical protein